MTNRHKGIMALFMGMITANAWSVSVGDITSLIFTNQTMLAKEVENTVDGARLVSLHVQRIDSPLEGGVEVAMDSEKEVLSTPANVILPGKGKDVFRIFYDGPADDQERYYRLNWQDNPVLDDGVTKSSKSAVASTSATISTILVVAPRQERFEYVYKDGMVYNYGNVTFRVVAYGPCLSPRPDGQKVCHERYYVMPGLGVKLRYGLLSDKSAHAGIWHNGNYIVVNDADRRIN